MIDQLTLTNFKAFQHAELRLGPLTLLTGLNSSGKSSVLQALGLLQQSYQAGSSTRWPTCSDCRTTWTAGAACLGPIMVFSSTANSSPSAQGATSCTRTSPGTNRRSPSR
ncbi:AAA family ATPase [Streptomyces sp. M10(2022)]